MKAGKTKYKGGRKLTIIGDKTAASYSDDIQPLFTMGGHGLTTEAQQPVLAINYATPGTPRR